MYNVIIYYLCNYYYLLLIIQFKRHTVELNFNGHSFDADFGCLEPVYVYLYLFSSTVLTNFTLKAKV